MKWPALLLAVLFLALQYPLWVGSRGWLRVREAERQLQAQRVRNAALVQRNAGLEAEVRDLRTGYDAIEERARFDLDMIKHNEIYVQLPVRK